MATALLATRAILNRGASHRPNSATSGETHHRRFPLSSVMPTPPPPPPQATTRRAASVSLLLLLLTGSSSGVPNRADAANPFDKYLKKKKLDPLEAYVPAVLLSRAQFEDLEKSLNIKQPKYDISRSLLRSGPAASLRINIRAVAQYAIDDGKGKVASNAVDKCLRALEELDSLLLHASRNDPTASIKSMKSQINVALGALDSLLQTVPPAVLDKGKAIADAYRVPSYDQEGIVPEDPEIKQLEQIL